MREPPPHVTDEDVLSTVAQNWDEGLDRIGHLPLGFGAYHWRASGPSEILFVTLDALGERHDADSLEAAYAGAASLAALGLEFVLAPLPTLGSSHRYTVPFEGGSLSVTPWRTGTTSGDGTMSAARARTTREHLDRLHAATAPVGIPRWRPLVAPDLADELAARTNRVWDSGPYAEDARVGILEHLGDIADWTATYHRLAEKAIAGEAAWVATHGEPHTRNQLVTPELTLLIDWESLKLAPPERDLRTLDEAGHPQRGADDEMLDLFDLEWRLDEISQYATWFEAWHTGTPSDAIAFGGLTAELSREGRHTRR